jgi:hypothetical protein
MEAEAPNNIQEPHFVEEDRRENVDVQNEYKFLARFDSVRIAASEPEASKPPVMAIPETTAVQETEVINVVRLEPEVQQIDTNQRDAQPEPHQREASSESEKEELKSNSARMVQNNAHTVVLENEILLLQRKMTLISDENRQLRESLRQAKVKA